MTAAELARVEALEAALLLCPRYCEHLHHAKADRHNAWEPCPVAARIAAALGIDQNGEPYLPPATKASANGASGATGTGVG